MNSRLLFTLIPLAGLLFSGCKKSETEKLSGSAGNAAITQPDVRPLPEPAAPDQPSENEKKLAQQLEEMQTRQLELELKLEEEKLARTEAEIKKERDLLEKEREAWRLEQELAAARAAPAATGKSPAVSSVPSTGPGFDYQMFYDDLAPLGSWYDSADYGYVWQPAVSVTDNTWRPYTLGSWASCDQGWTWCSDEPFGWACYHYGRWAKLRGRGWVWVPGDQWAPSWVSWRRNDDYIGWCPLPPETVYHREYTWGSTIDRDCGIHPGSYVFMPVKHFDRPCRNYCEVPSACVTIFASTVNITNIVVRPGRVECHGPKYEWIKERVRRPLPRYNLTCDADTRGRRDRGPRIEKDRLYCYAPRVQAPWNTQLRPSRHAALDKLEVLRAEGGLPNGLAGRYKSEKTEREKETGNLKGGAKVIAERQQRLASLEQTRESLREQMARENTGGRPAVPDNSTAAERPDRSAKPQERPARPQPGNSAPAIAGPVVKTPVSTPAPQPGLIAHEPEDQAASQVQLEQKRKEAEAALRRETTATDKSKQDKQSALRAQLEETRRWQQEAAAARNQNAAPQPVAEEPRQVPETALRDDSNARTEAAAREMDRQSALRAQLEEKRRLQQEARSEQSRARAETVEQQQAAETAARAENSRNEAVSRELDKQSALRAQLEEKRRQQQEVQNEQAAAQRTAMESQRRQEEAAAKAEQQARQREAMEQQRAAIEQQRRQAEAETRQRQIQEDQRRNAEEQQQRRQDEEMQRRQAEAETRQRQIQEEQRRNTEEQQQRRQAEEMQRRQQAEAETRQRQIQEEQRRNAEEQQRRQAEEQERGRGKR